ncbi:hypothetical protein H257_06388 [Aphanomyces astaci]|uniref:Uncharacterized protein n=2 Tax=Aphanomyces astaci TaxID=112090 RepID=W4GPY4_APHAT|nr:hypothetical protein H257_06388 [Aphanomyces astaci]ETV80943.1 hypothetical protein H257_06388 [Aphanomyces astaci]|eukprot:XP_009829890.1 hypothetical protein H257_06388 [Aphanomyces astaci]
MGDIKSSMDAVIAWMSLETNYVRWKGGDKHSGSTKASLASEIVQCNSAKKRTAAAAKMDDWSEISARAYALKKEQLEFTHDAEKQKLEVVKRREARLTEETKLNVQLLTIQAEEAHWKFELARETEEVDARIRKIQTRKDLKERGWIDVDINLACPM